MGSYKTQRPLSDVRLRNWPAGRAAEMKLMVSQLESSLAEMRGPAIAQTAKRQFNDQIPFILDLSVVGGYRQFVLNFSEPPGLNSNHPQRQLQFYEIQHDSTPGFSNPTILETPQNHIIIGGADSRETRFFRVRTINTLFQASRWTSTIQATTAAGQMFVTLMNDGAKRVTGEVGGWKTILEYPYTVSDGGAIALNAHISVAGIQEDVQVKGVEAETIINTYRSGPAFVQVRWMIRTNLAEGFKQVGSRGMFSARPGYTGIKLGKAPMAFGSFISPFIRPNPGEIFFQLQAAKCPGSEWKGGSGTDELRTSDPLVISQNTKVIEVIERF